MVRGLVLHAVSLPPYQECGISLPLFHSSFATGVSLWDLRFALLLPFSLLSGCTTCEALRLKVRTAVSPSVCATIERKPAWGTIAYLENSLQRSFALRRISWTASFRERLWLQLQTTNVHWCFVRTSLLFPTSTLSLNHTARVSHRTSA